MPPPRDQQQAASRRRLVEGFRQDAAAAGDDGIGAEHEGPGMTCRDLARLFLGETERVMRGRLARPWGLVDFGGIDGIRAEPHLHEKIAPARRGGGEDEGSYRLCRAHAIGASEVCGAIFRGLDPCMVISRQGCDAFPRGARMEGAG